MALNCANCGAAMEPVGSRNYFRCPYCESFHFPDETPDGVAVIGDESRLGCPVCNEKLVAAAIHGDPVRYCRTCRGFLADNPAFGRIVTRKRAARGNAPYVPTPFSRDELKRRIACPKCAKPMDTHPYHGGGNAVIDTCHRCHLVWLDAGEVSVIGSYPGREPAPVVAPAAEPSDDAAAAAEPGEELAGGEVNLLGFRVRLF